MDISETNDLSGTGNMDHIEGVCHQILKLATNGDINRFGNNSLSGGIETRKTVDAFIRSPRHFADSVWKSIRMKEERIPETAPTVPPQLGKQLNQLCKIEKTSLTCA